MQTIGYYATGGNAKVVNIGNLCLYSIICSIKHTHYFEKWFKDGKEHAETQHNISETILCKVQHGKDPFNMHLNKIGVIVEKSMPFVKSPGKKP